MTETEEGTDFVRAFKTQNSRFADPKKTEARRQAERKAGRTPGQRARKATREKQINFRTTDEIKALSDALSEHLGMSVAKVIDRALTELAKSLPEFGGKK